MLHSLDSPFVNDNHVTDCNTNKLGKHAITK